MLVHVYVYVHVCVTAREGRRSTRHTILPLKGCKDRRKTRPGALDKRKSWLNKERVKKASSQFSGLAKENPTPTNEKGNSRMPPLPIPQPR